MRTGFGFDSHVFAPSGTLVLGGVQFRGIPKLKGHSDGDAVLHALVDALLGAACLGDIGDYFSDKNPLYKDVTSRLFVRDTMALLKKNKFHVQHVDITVLANRPKLAHHKADIKTALSSMLKIPIGLISVKAKTQEGLTLFKRPGGIAVWAVATIEKIK